MNLKDTKLNFGIEALEWLDDHYEKIETQNGIELKASIMTIATDKAMGNLSTLSKLIHAGTLTSKKTLGIKEINKALEALNFDELQELFNKVFTNFVNSAPVMYRIKKLGWEEVIEDAEKA